jgi:hypothetical protein
MPTLALSLSPSTQKYIIYPPISLNPGIVMVYEFHYYNLPNKTRPDSIDNN